LKTRVAGIFLLCALPAFLPAAVIDTVNGSSSPAPYTYTGIGEVGWLYTPSFGYDLTGVETQWFSVTGDAVTLEIYSDLPSSGGTLLRTVDFTPTTEFGGATFSALTLTAGTPIFIGFQNVTDLGVNVTEDDGDYISPFYFSTDTSGTYDQSDPDTVFLGQPILQFLGTDTPETAPEPSAVILIGTGLLGLAIGSRRLSRR
jgi:PEP-CTERM motif